MNGLGPMDEAHKAAGAENLFRDITLGEVVDTNDPQQMGRVRVICPAMGDDDSVEVGNIPWATCMTPFAGIDEISERGRENDKSEGPVAYGMWNIPKLGSTVVVACIDGDTRFRVWLGCIHPQFMTHTMPHGRYIANGTNLPDGPLTSIEEPILPLKTHQTVNFTPHEQSEIVPDAPTPNSDYLNSFEYKSRGADYSVSNIRDEFISSDETGNTTVGDDNFEDEIQEDDGNTIVHQNGYIESRSMPEVKFDATDDMNFDPQVYSWTTPGFHAIAMDDNPKNCRIRLRTTHGHQIILDDTNERLYMSTPNGDTWIEMDEKGNIDIYAKRNVSFHSEEDINFTTKKTFRVKAGEGIHMESDDEIRFHNKGELGGDFHIRSETNIRQHSVENTYNESDAQIHIKSVDSIFVLTDNEYHLKSDASMFVESNDNLNIKSTSDMFIETDSNINIKSALNMNLETDLIMNLKSGVTMSLESTAPMSMTAPTINMSGYVSMDNSLAVEIDVITTTILAELADIAGPDNGHNAIEIGDGESPTVIPAIPAESANTSTAPTNANPAEEFQAFWTNKIPEHEPFARVMTDPAITDLDVDNAHEDSAEFPYNSPKVGREERGFDMTRNSNWHR
jgi:phage baseplate assembly protein gpV